MKEILTIIYLSVIGIGLITIFISSAIERQENVHFGANEVFDSMAFLFIWPVVVVAVPIILIVFGIGFGLWWLIDKLHQFVGKLLIRNNSHTKEKVQN